ncbi:MAG: hypothetical protein JWO06_1208 [Bacteroidota bacterium]|nr:hypothetical protein [Bacteroidota bacterium]
MKTRITRPYNTRVAARATPTKILAIIILSCLFYVCQIECATAAVRFVEYPMDSSLLVKTTHGQILGSTKDSVSMWKGIRYAKAPVGALRFHSPQPVEDWKGYKTAYDFGPVAPQINKGMRDKQKQDEDCLYLNIWSPGADGKKRPVMFWIHGGGFMTGSSSSELYDGAGLCKNGDVVVVSINYRLGPLGFLYFKDLPGGNNFENNLGIKDQVAALQWVKENINRFGGDSASVTIFGESAGAISVLTLMGTPSAKGLFKRAISESGAPDMLWRPKLATEVTKMYLKVLGVSPDSLFKLKTISVDTLNAAVEGLVKIFQREPTVAKTFAPTIDGDLIPQDLMTAISAGSKASADVSKGAGQVATCGGVDLLIGTNKDEANLFAIRKLKMVPVSAKQLEPYVARIKPEGQKRILGAYKNYPKKSGVLEIITDGIFTVPSMQFAELQCSNGSTYMYRFDWSSFPLRLLGLRSCHGLELPFVFGTLDQGKIKKLGIMANRKTMHGISKQMQQAWINFARTGNPNSSGQSTWAKYDAAQRNTMIFDTHIHLASDPKADKRNAWKGLSIFE